MINDMINGSFECIGGFLCWINVYKLYKDKNICGVYWPTTAFFSAWGLWNLYYYPSLSQYWSFIGGLFIATGNITWVIMAMSFTIRKRGLT